MKKQKFQKWVDKYKATLKDGQFYSEPYGEFIDIVDVDGFCPVCEEPLIWRDIEANMCPHCGARLPCTKQTVEVKIEKH